MQKVILLTAALAVAPALPVSGADLAPVILTLAEAHATALRNHPQVEIAQLRALVSQEISKQNQAAYYPTVDGYFDAVAAGNRNTRLLAGGLNNPVIYDRVADGFGAAQLITDFGRTRNLIASARFSAKAEAQNAAATKEEILLNVDANYFNVLQTQAVLGVAKETARARQLLVDQVTALEMNRLKSELDVSFAEVALEQSRLFLQRASGDADGAQASLSSALGYRQARRYELADEPTRSDSVPDVHALIEFALETRPDLLRSRYERDAAGSFAAAERDRNYPTITAIGEIGNAISHDARLPDKYAAGGITVDLPLFAGGSYLARQHEAELKTEIAAQALRDLEDTVSRDVRLAWINFNTSLERLATTERLLKHANQAFALAQARYKNGSSSIVELSDAQVNATSAQIAEANARYDTLLQRAILDYQIGALKP